MVTPSFIRLAFFGSRGLLARNPKCSPSPGEWSSTSLRGSLTENLAGGERMCSRSSRATPGAVERKTPAGRPPPSPHCAIAGVGRVLSSRPPAAARRRADARAGEAALRQDLGKNTLEHLQGGSALVAEAEDALRAPDAG